MTALAKLLTVIAAFQGPLLQRSSRTVLRTASAYDTDIAIHLKDTELSPNFIGWNALKDSPWANFLTPQFIPAMRAFSRRSPMQVEYTGCDDTCTAEVIGPGLDFRCSSYAVDFSINFNFTKDNIHEKFTRVFETQPTNEGHLNSMGLNVIHKAIAETRETRTGCQGKLVVTNCTAHDAVVRYKVTLSNQTITLANITMDPVTSKVQNDTVRLVYGNFTNEYRDETPNLGGLAMALVENTIAYFDYNDSPPPMIPYAYGSLAKEMISSGIDTYGHCNLTFTNPTKSVLSDMREVIFRAALEDSKNTKDAKGDAFRQVVRGKQMGNAVFYESDWRWMLAGIILPFVAALAILWLGSGYSEMKRKVTLSPIETGRSFAAEVLAGGQGGNEDVDNILEQVGMVPVIYDYSGAGTRSIRRRVISG